MMGMGINQQFGNAATSPLAAVSRTATSSQEQSAPSEDKHAVVYPLPVKDILLIGWFLVLLMVAAAVLK
jgi:hypothetical protein